MSTGPICQLLSQQLYRTNKILKVCVSLHHLWFFFFLNNNFQKYFVFNNYYFFVVLFHFEIILWYLDIYGSSFSFFHWPLPSSFLDILPFFCFFSSRLLPCLNSLNNSSTNISMKSTFYLCPPHLRAADEPLTFVTQFV